MSSLEKLVEEISVDKEILNTLPQNNKKNIGIYLNKINEFSEKYKSYNKDFIAEIEKRSKKLDGKKVSENLHRLEEELSNMESVLYLLNDVDSSYEKMALDKEISNLTYYYRKDLDKINETIDYCIKKFEEVGIKLTSKDFFFNQYVHDYVSAIFQAVDIKNLNKDKINNKFENIYWKCPEIITYIELNIRYLYSKNEKSIDKYYKNQREKLLKNFSKETMQNNYNELKKQVIEENKKDECLLIKQFLEGKLLVKDYEKSAIIDIVYRFTGRKDLNEISDEELNNIIVNLIKLLNTIREYKNYCKFKFIIDDVKNVYAEKEKYKGEYARVKKEISAKEAKVIKLGKPNFFGKTSNKNLSEQTKLILEEKALYKELENNEVYDKIANVLTDQSTLYDALYLASSFYKYLFRKIIGEDKEIPENELNEKIGEIKEFLHWPYFTILNNIKINEEKDIMLIIKDRYNLLNINITKEDLEVDNLDNLISLLSRCETYFYLKEKNINLEEVEDIYELKKILKNI